MFRPVKEVDFVHFCKLVKTMKFVVVTGTTRMEVELPLKFYNVPIFQLRIEGGTE